MDLEKSNFTKYSGYKPADSDVGTISELYKIISKRRSIRHFSSAEIDHEILQNAIRIAGTAPSGANRQPWFFAIIKSKEVKAKIRKAAEQVESEFYNLKAPESWLLDLKMFETNSHKPYLEEAPALIVVFSKIQNITDTGNIEKCYYSLESTCISVGLLISSLHLAGVSTLTHTPRPLNFMNELLGLPPYYRPVMIVVAGYPAENCHVPNIQRKELKEICKTY